MSTSTEPNAGNGATTTSQNATQGAITRRPWTICGFSRSMWYKLRSERRTPPALSLGPSRGANIYLVATITRWLEAGCPDRRTFRATQRKAVRS